MAMPLDCRGSQGILVHPCLFALPCERTMPEKMKRGAPIVIPPGFFAIEASNDVCPVHKNSLRLVA